eukprot:TRINITY_DN67864_c0_g1_i1.p1 TRINITY_DN67864_c0_g1~~TRINITY_DN67864_c0_g1_i1.p1  ORF type:complete len:723 (+),score=68.94 TRINITY_DN67864_c0_g1_i1:140-2308(+)
MNLLESLPCVLDAVLCASAELGEMQEVLSSFAERCRSIRVQLDGAGADIKQRHLLGSMLLDAPAPSRESRCSPVLPSVRLPARNDAEIVVDSVNLVDGSSTHKPSEVPSNVAVCEQPVGGQIHLDESARVPQRPETSVSVHARRQTERVDTLGKRPTNAASSISTCSSSLKLTRKSRSIDRKISVRSRPLPSGKLFHYFLSHKKKHSRWADASEHVARSLHDSLEASGYTGFFDIDTLAIINRDALNAAIKASCCMLVVLSDETTTSEWCRYEWSVAATQEIEIQIIIDCQRFNKSDVLGTLFQHPMLLKNQCIEYTDTCRRACFNSLDLRLQQMLRLRVLQTTSFKSLTEVVSPSFAVLMHVAGTPYDTEGTACSQVWIWAARLLTLACLVVCLLREISVTRFELDYVALSTYVCAIHLVVFHNSFVSSHQRCRVSEDLIEEFGDIRGSRIILEDVRQRLHNTSIVGIVAACVFSLVGFVIYVFPYFDEETDSEARKKASMVHAITFLLSSPVVFSQSSSIFVHIKLSVELLVAIFEATFETLDCRMETMGFENFIGSPIIISPHESSMRAFRESWINANSSFDYLQSKVATTLILHFALHFLGVLAPCFLWHFRRSNYRGLEWFNFCRIITWWVYATGGYVITLLLPFITVHRLKKMARSGRKLTFQTSEHQRSFDALMSHDIIWQVGHVNYDTTAVLLALGPLLFSGHAVFNICLETYS